jgi:uncharacterized membrane protein
MLDFTLTFLGLVLVVGIDAVYLNLNKSMYEPIMDPNDKLNLVYGVLSWLSIVIAIQLLVLSRPDLTNSNVFINGVFLGFAMYAVYNFTNAATYPSKWSNTIIIGDTAWGMLLTGGVALGMYKIKDLMKY